MAIDTSVIDVKISHSALMLEDVLSEIDDIEIKDVKSAIEKFILIRDKLKIIRKPFDDLETFCKQRQFAINEYLIGLSQQFGVDSFKTEYGTAYKTVKTSYRVENWDAYSKWLIETGNMQCIEKRAAKLAVKEVHDETGEIPPGLMLYQEIEFTFRKG